MNKLFAYDIEATRVVLGGIGRSTVFRLLADGKLEGRKLGRRTLITRTSIQNYMRSAPIARIAKRHV